ncbi:MAG: hypothetical protein Q7K16_03815 [Candidatus Azambacteria bacterium]|nr:hypothetical protein [Candidatus Azambacteria bacterium]
MDFWQVHGWLFLILITLFPRLMMLLAVTTPFGWLAWLGWIFTPSLLVAILATTYYWHTNPVLCVIAWLFAFGKFGETSHTVNSRRQ